MCHAILHPRTRSTAIIAADLPALRRHLDLALRHLEDADAMASSVTGDVPLTAIERFTLNEDVAEAGLLVERLSRAIAGTSLEEELARFLHTVD
jgi:hypothetical protein